MGQLQLDIGSHLSMSVAGWSHPMDRQTFYTAALLSQVKNMLRGEKEEPFTPDWPWPDEEEAPDVTAEERAVLEARLRASSALAQIRTPEAAPSINE